MDSYISGAGGALAEIAEMVYPAGQKRFTLPGRIKINLLGATPLDFSVNGSVREMEKYLEGQGFSVLSTWAMGNTLDRILSSADADVNLVVSACGLAAAKVLLRRFGTPFVVGVPVGRENSREICEKLREAARAGTASCRGESGGQTKGQEIPEEDRAESQDGPDAGGQLLIIGEPVFADALASEISLSGDPRRIRIVCPMSGVPSELLSGKEQILYEPELREACRIADRIIADPLYRRLLPGEEGKFISLPHTAYSGRYYENEMPVLIGERLDRWLSQSPDF
jgi:hypothetical protein